MSKDDTEQLIDDLLVRAGMLMEDISVEAISSLPEPTHDRQKRIREIARGGLAVGALTFAVWCLSQRSILTKV